MQYNIIAQPATDEAVIYQANLYLDHVSKTKSLSTYKTYSDKISVFVKWWTDNPMQRPLKLHLEAFKSYVGMKYPSGRSKNLLLSVVRNLFRYLYEMDILDVDHAKHIKNFKVSDGHSKSALDKYQLHNLLEYLKDETLRNRALLSLAISNGLRINEISNILIEDLDMKDGDHILWLLRKGYDSKDNYTILAPQTHSLLMEYAGNRERGYLFSSQKGEGLATASISKLIKKILRGAGIDSKAITAHSMRHTFARLCLDAGVNITQIMAALNHKHLSSTQVYARAYERHSKSAEKSINIYAM